MIYIFALGLIVLSFFQIQVNRNQITINKATAELFEDLYLRIDLDEESE